MTKLKWNSKYAWLKAGIYIILCLMLLFSVVGAGIAGTALADEDSISANLYIVDTFVDEQGREISKVIYPGRPPEIKAAAVSVPEPNPFMGTNTISNVPAFDWCYGCSATSAAMMMGYYDRTGYSNMYAGPTNGGVCPMDNSIWGPSLDGMNGECPLSATHQGKDELAGRGHVDDYWIEFSNPGPDPYIGHWTEHTHGDCTADYMGTSQSKYGNPDGSTQFYWNNNGDPLYDNTACEPAEIDGCHGMRTFAESRGYTVNTNYTQLIHGYPGTDPDKGFTFDDYKAQIDAGRPVLIQVVGHSMLGYGYNDPDTVYLHNTWDHADHEMTWGGTYSLSLLQHRAVTVLELAPVGLPPDISVSPSSFEKTMPPNTSQSYPLSIGNTGGSTLSYTVTDENTITAPGEAGETALPSAVELTEEPPRQLPVEDEAEVLPEATKSPPLSSAPASIVLDIPLEKGTGVEPERTFTAGGWQNIMTDDFEGDFPGSIWNVFASSGYTDAYWGKDSSQYMSPSNSVFCAKDGFAGVSPPAYYPDYMTSWMIYGPFSLSDATDAELNFNRWIDTEANCDYLWSCASIGGSWAGKKWSGGSGVWVAESFDLTTVYSLGDLCGQPEVWVAFLFQSDSSFGDYGAFIDDVVLRKYVESPGCSWLSESPSSGTVPNGDPADSISVTFNSNGLATGDYNANILVASNDPDEAEVAVPVTLHVISGVSSPVVNTNAATNVEETTATLNGGITDTGGNNCDYRGFVWGTTSHGDPGNIAPASSVYDSNWPESGSYTTGAFSHGITGLTGGTRYYFRACAHNSAGWSYGAEQSFLLKPEPPASFTATNFDTTRIDLSWTKGAGAQKTKIQRKVGSYPTDRTDGTQVYFDTGTAVSDTGLAPNTSYYYRAWSYVGGSDQWSDTYAQASAGTYSGYGIPLVSGWNLVSLPLIPVNTATAAVISASNLASGNINNISVIYLYDTATINWKSWVNGAGTLTTMEDGPAYWIYANDADTLTVHGTEAASPNYPVLTGWNMVGFTSTTGMELEAYLDSIDGDYVVVYRWNAVAGEWSSWTEYGNTFDTMSPGCGYWLYMNADGIITPP